MQITTEHGPANHYKSFVDDMKLMGLKAAFIGSYACMSVWLIPYWYFFFFFSGLQRVFWLRPKVIGKLILATSMGNTKMN